MHGLSCGMPVLNSQFLGPIPELDTIWNWKEADKREKKKKKKISVCSSVPPMALYVCPPLLEGCASPDYRVQDLKLLCRQLTPVPHRHACQSVQKANNKRENRFKMPFFDMPYWARSALVYQERCRDPSWEGEEAANGSDSVYADRDCFQWRRPPIEDLFFSVSELLKAWRATNGACARLSFYRCLGSFALWSIPSWLVACT